MRLRSKRLQAIARMIEKHQYGDILADIGTDHAYLPCFLYEQGIITRGYACDIGEGPLESAKATIASCQLEDVITPLLGDGLAPLVSIEVDMIAICGMGGILMMDIIEAHRNLCENRMLILQANTAIDELRRYLSTHHFQIIDEGLVKEGRHIYEILVVKSGEQDLSEADCLFGPILRKQGDPLFQEKWTKEYQVVQRIFETLEPSHEKYPKMRHYENMLRKELRL